MQKKKAWTLDKRLLRQKTDFRLAKHKRAPKARVDTAMIPSNILSRNVHKSMKQPFLSDFLFAVCLLRTNLNLRLKHAAYFLAPEKSLCV